jgi:hypothetical protein
MIAALFEHHQVSGLKGLSEPIISSILHGNARSTLGIA